MIAAATTRSLTTRSGLLVLVALLAACLALPATVLADPGNGNGHGNGRDAATSDFAADDAQVTEADEPAFDNVEVAGEDESYEESTPTASAEIVDVAAPAAPAAPAPRPVAPRATTPTRTARPAAVPAHATSRTNATGGDAADAETTPASEWSLLENDDDSVATATPNNRTAPAAPGTAQPVGSTPQPSVVMPILKSTIADHGVGIALFALLAAIALVAWKGWYRGLPLERIADAGRWFARTIVGTPPAKKSQTTYTHTPSRVAYPGATIVPIARTVTPTVTRAPLVPWTIAVTEPPANLQPVPDVDWDNLGEATDADETDAEATTADEAATTTDESTGAREVDLPKAPRLTALFEKQEDAEEADADDADAVEVAAVEVEAVA